MSGLNSPPLREAYCFLTCPWQQGPWLPTRTTLHNSPPALPGISQRPFQRPADPACAVCTRLTFPPSLSSSTVSRQRHACQSPTCDSDSTAHLNLRQISSECHGNPYDRTSRLDSGDLRIGGRCSHTTRNQSANDYAVSRTMASGHNGVKQAHPNHPANEKTHKHPGTMIQSSFPACRRDPVEPAYPPPCRLKLKMT